MTDDAHDLETTPPSVDVGAGRAFASGTGDTPEPTLDDALGGRVAKVLRSTHPAKWHLLALRMDTESGEITIESRGSLAAHLRANGLDGLADDAMRRRVPTGCLLALLVRDTGPVWHVIGCGRRAP